MCIVLCLYIILCCCCCWFYFIDKTRENLQTIIYLLKNSSKYSFMTQLFSFNVFVFLLENSPKAMIHFPSKKISSSHLCFLLISFYCWLFYYWVENSTPHFSYSNTIKYYKIIFSFHLCNMILISHHNLQPNIVGMLTLLCLF